MFRPLRLFVPAFLAIALLAAGWSLNAEEPAALPRKIEVTTSVKKGVITFSWPVIRGKWGLYEQQPAFTGEWKLLADDLHHTNSTTVSVSITSPTNTALFQVKRVFRHAAMMPPVPKAAPKTAKRPPTNP